MYASIVLEFHICRVELSMNSRRKLTFAPELGKAPGHHVMSLLKPPAGTTTSLLFPERPHKAGVPL